jgi:predicted CopG family antitoxin
MGTHTKCMSKNISISDDVYERLRREKGDRSFSEVIAEQFDEGASLSDVTGQQILPDDTPEAVKTDVREMSEGTLDRLEE